MVTARSRALLVAPLVGAALLLSACGNATDQPGSGTGTGGQATTAPSSAAPASPTPSTAPPSDSGSGGGGSKVPGPPGIPIGTGKPVSLQGTIEAGVEPGCRILTAGNMRYLVLTSMDVPMGVPVQVEGILMPGVLSTCQQGTPLRVTSVKRR